MKQWKKNLYVMFCAQFMVMSAVSLILPFLPLYINTLGVSNPGEVAIWSGIVASANFIPMALLSPVWGSIADRHGRKTMVMRSVIALAIFTSMMGFSQSVWHLVALRLLMGCFSGFNAAAVALVSTTVPDERLGYSLSVLQSGQLAGTVLGPLLGGILADMMGFRQVFIITGLLNLVAALLVLLMVKEEFVPLLREEKNNTLSDIRRWVFNPILLPFFVAFFVAQFSLRIVEPILTLFVKTIYTGNFLSLVVGLVFAATGISNLIGSPVVGRMADKAGYKHVLALGLLSAGALYWLQGMAEAPWQLMTLRFFLGISLAGILPAANAMIGRMIPVEKRGGVFGLTASAIFLGSLLGPLTGGFIAASFGIRWIFRLAAMLLLLNGVWVIYGLKYEHHERTAEEQTSVGR